MGSIKKCQHCPVWKNSLFKDFDADLIDWLSERKTVQVFNKDDALFNQGDAVSGIFCHANGLAKVVQNDHSGRTRFSRLVFPGDTSGHRSLFIEVQYKGTTKVISDQLQACFIPKEDVLYLIPNSASFAKNLIIKIAEELQRSEQETISAKQKTVRNRLAYLIYNLCNEYADKIDELKYLIKSQITKREMAGLLNVANETVIRLMSEMKTEGLISYQNKKLLVEDYEKIKLLSKL